MACDGCQYLKVVSVPDWFKCKVDGREFLTQTELYKNCILLCPHNKMLFPGSNICAECGSIIV